MHTKAACFGAVALVRIMSCRLIQPVEPAFRLDSKGTEELHLARLLLTAVEVERLTWCLAERDAIIAAAKPMSPQVAPRQVSRAP